MDAMDLMEQNEAEFNNFEKLILAAVSGETKKDRKKMLHEPLEIARFWFDEAIQRGMTIETFRKDNKEQYDEIKRHKAESLETATLINRLSDALQAQVEINVKLTEENNNHRNSSRYQQSVEEIINLENLNANLAEKCDQFEKDLLKSRADLEKLKLFLNTTLTRETMLTKQMLMETFKDETKADEFSVTNGDCDEVEDEDGEDDMDVAEEYVDVEEMKADKIHTLLSIQTEELGHEDLRLQIGTPVADETTDRILACYVNEFESFLENLRIRSSPNVEIPIERSESVTHVPRKRKLGKKRSKLEQLKKARAARGKKGKKTIN